MAKKEELLNQINWYKNTWARTMRMYGAGSAFLRVFIIAASACVAAKAAFVIPIHNLNIPDTSVSAIVPFLSPTLSLLVAIFAALEAWLKPRDKWKGFMDVGQKAENIIVDLNSSDDPVEIEKLED